MADRAKQRAADAEKRKQRASSSLPTEEKRVQSRRSSTAPSPGAEPTPSEGHVDEEELASTRHAEGAATTANTLSPPRSRSSSSKGRRSSSSTPSAGSGASGKDTEGAEKKEKESSAGKESSAKEKAKLYSQQRAVATAAAQEKLERQKAEKRKANQEYRARKKEEKLAAAGDTSAVIASAKRKAHEAKTASDAEPPKKKKKAEAKPKDDEGKPKRRYVRKKNKDQDENEEEEKKEHDEDELVDDTIYCVCKTLYDPERMMVACDRCDDWYHAECQKIKKEDSKLILAFICTNCEPQTDLRTTWKEKCLRRKCRLASRWPLSRYCSETCGVIVAHERLKKMKGRTPGSKSKALRHLALSLWPREELRKAHEREGLVEWKPEEEVRIVASCDGSANPWHASTAGIGVTPAFDIEALRQGNALDASIARNVAFLNTITSASQKIEEDIARLRIELDVIRTARHRVTSANGLLKAKEQLFALAKARKETLPRLFVEQEEESDEEESDDGSAKKKKPPKPKNSKSRKKAPSADQGALRCGFDERLGWDDELLAPFVKSEKWARIRAKAEPLDGKVVDEVVPHATSAAREPWICGAHHRKCKRHSAWEEFVEEANLKEHELLVS